MLIHCVPRVIKSLGDKNLMHLSPFITPFCSPVSTTIVCECNSILVWWDVHSAGSASSRNISQLCIRGLRHQSPFSDIGCPKCVNGGFGTIQPPFWEGMPSYEGCKAVESRFLSDSNIYILIVLEDQLLLIPKTQDTIIKSWSLFSVVYKNYFRYTNPSQFQDAFHSQARCCCLAHRDGYR